MVLSHTFEKNNQRLSITVDYNKKERVVEVVYSVMAINLVQQPSQWQDITYVLGEYFNLDEVIDKIDWAEKAAS